MNAQASRCLLYRELLRMLLLQDCLLVREWEELLGLPLTVRHVKRVICDLGHGLRHLRLISNRCIHYITATTVTYWLTCLKVKVTLV